tara:strand:+ start:627 stop:1496 length:870 start_codon:yes stop_codon:yes gene_type:complete
MGKYTVRDIIGQPRTLKNGAIAGYVMNNEGKKVWRIIQGADEATMAGLRARRSGSRKRANYSAKGAKNVMARYYNKKSYKSPARRAAAMKRDMCHKGKSVVNDSRWAQNPRRHDLQGFDDGSLCDGKVTEYKYRAPSAKQAAALAKGRAKRASMRGGADGCGFRAESMRCAKGVETNQEWCQMGKKGRCVKSPAGRKSAPRRKASAKQLAGLAKGRATRAANVAAKKASSPKPSHMMAMACKNLPMDDCVAHPMCNYVKASVGPKGKAHKAYCKKSTKGIKRGKRSPRN